MSVTSGTLVVCPCGSEYTHFNLVIMLARPLGEDGVIEAVTVSSTGLMSRKLLNNETKGERQFYSSRRHSIQVVGDCEECTAQTVISITQYKGQTYIRSQSTAVAGF